MPIATTTITQSGQISLPKVFREILGVKPNDQVALLSDGERVQIVKVPKDPLTLGTREEFLGRLERAERERVAGNVCEASVISQRLKETYGL